MGFYYSNGVFYGRLIPRTSSGSAMGDDDEYVLTDDKCVQGPKNLHFNFGNIDSNIEAHDLENGFVKKSEVLGLLNKWCQIKPDQNLLALIESLEKWDGSDSDNAWNYYEACTSTLEYPCRQILKIVLPINPEI